MVFVPVGLNYDRVLEDRVLVAAVGDKSARFRFRISHVARYVGRHLWQRLTGKFHRLGFAAVAFGQPISLKAFLAEAPKETTKLLGAELMRRISQVVPILPVPLVCRHLEAGGGQLGRAAIETKFGADVARLRAAGMELCLPPEIGGTGYVRAVDEALRMLEVRGLVRQVGGRVELTDKAPDVISYYAASLAHLPAT